MARLSQGTGLLDSASPPPDAAVSELTQLLLRMQNNLLHPTPERERRLRTSEYERAKVEANLEYARNLLTRLEQEALHVKAPTRRAETQNLLNVNRDRLETLLDRLEDLRQLAVDEDDNSSEEEDLLGHVIPTPSESMDSRSSDTKDDSQILETPPDPPTPEPIPLEPARPTPTSTTIAASSVPATQTSQTMRSRPTAQAPSPTPNAPSSSHTTARAALHSNRLGPYEAQKPTATAEAILENQQAEQDDLSNSILQLAGALKKSSKRFAATLEADKALLDQTGQGMDKAGQSMAAASGRMGMLQRMTEGKGWWGRMILYAWVYGLMIGLLLLVFVMPKLRF